MKHAPFSIHPCSDDHRKVQDAYSFCNIQQEMLVLLILPHDTKDMKFNEYSIDGWKCIYGETYYESEQAQKILLLNKLKKETIRSKLGKIRSNLIVRLPKDIESALNLQKGEEVLIQIEGKGLKIALYKYC